MSVERGRLDYDKGTFQEPMKDRKRDVQERKEERAADRQAYKEECEAECKKRLDQKEQICVEIEMFKMMINAFNRK